MAVVAGVRTPFAKAGTKLKDCSAVHLGVTAIREAMARIDLKPEQIDEVVFGNAGTPADAANISRVIALRAGIPEGIRHRIFEPFFTTKEVGRGTGQGLFLASTIVARKHAGAIRFISEPAPEPGSRRGTTFVITLPTAGGEASS